MTHLNTLRHGSGKSPKYAEEFGVGNCCEKACLAFRLINDAMPDELVAVNIELFNNPIDDHFVAVLNRDSSTNTADPRSWKKDVIFCDPWIEERCYQVGEVDFVKLKAVPFEVMKYLIPDEGHEEAIDLFTEVLATSVLGGRSKGR